MIGQEILGGADFPIHPGVELFHHPGDLRPDRIDDGLGLFGALPDNLVLLFYGRRLGLAKLLLVGGHFLFDGFLEAPDFGLGILELLLPSVNHAEDRFVEQDIQNKDQQQKIDDLNSKGIIETNHCPSPQMISNHAKKPGVMENMNPAAGIRPFLIEKSIR
jgi:hypothetical protein